jgi:BirA family biotin operon repressor/biotin-[acetyl-CoA-carboxylase] ligase
MADPTLPTPARLGRALAALAQASGALCAAELAAAAEIAAGEVAGLVGELRALGAEVAGSEAEGWRLTEHPDLPLAEILEPKIVATIFSGGVHHFARIDSTNAAAMRAGAGQENGDSGGEVWLAEEQTAGRGRAGHTWTSKPRDGIYLSALLRPQLAPSDVILLSLAAGLAVVEAVHEVTGIWADLRWPNDVLLGGKKFCGILAEMSAGAEGVRFVVVGVGVNVNHAEFPAELAPIATSLGRELGQRVSRVELAAALLRALDHELVELSHDAAAARDRILRRFEQHSSFCRDAEVTVEEDGGYSGSTRGLDELGFLRVETATGMRTVRSGGVRKR